MYEVSIQFSVKEIKLIKRLVKEFELWPGCEETPNGVHLSEEDDKTWLGIIKRIEDLK